MCADVMMLRLQALPKPKVFQSYDQSVFVVLFCAGAAGACAQREVPHPFLHVHGLREPPQTLPSAQSGQAGYSRGEGGRRKCKYTSQFLTHSPSTSAPLENVIYPPSLPSSWSPHPPASSPLTPTVSCFLCAPGQLSPSPF